MGMHVTKEIFVACDVVYISKLIVLVELSASTKIPGMIVLARLPARLVHKCFNHAIVGGMFAEVLKPQ